MTYEYHENLPHSRDHAKQMIDRALAENLTLYIAYRDGKGNETRRNIQPLEWVEDYKIRAFCLLQQAERHFVLSRIKDIGIVDTESAGHSPHTDSIQTTVPPRTSSREQWRASKPTAGAHLVKPPNRQPHSFSEPPSPQIQNSQQWQQLVRYYVECLNREYLQNYVLEQSGHNYHFFPQEDEGNVFRFLAGHISFDFPILIDRQPTEIVEFILDPKRQDQELCLGFPVLLAYGKMAPLFFVSCKVEKQENIVRLYPDEYEVSYAVVRFLDLDKEEFTEVVRQIDWLGFESLAERIRALQDALLLKIEEFFGGSAIPRREEQFPRLRETSNDIVLATTPGLFWASKNRYTGALIEELENLSNQDWNAIPVSVSQFLDVSKQQEYSTPLSFEGDKKVYVSPINNEQRKAAHAALEMPLTVVTGPPGTGKSQLVLNIIANAVLEGKSVLFASRNNRAVDVVASRIQAGNFPGMIRSGNREERRKAAHNMLQALPKIAMPHEKKSLPVLIDGYRRSRAELVNQSERLEEIQRLAASINNKRQELEAILKDLPQQPAELIRRESLALYGADVKSSREITISLMEAFKRVEQRKELIESVLQERIADNRHGYALVNDIARFEGERGRFGSGENSIRRMGYFGSLDALQQHLQLWRLLVDAVEARLAAERIGSEITELERKLSLLNASLANELQLETHHAAGILSDTTLDSLDMQVSKVQSLISKARKRSLSNLFGFRRGPQIEVVRTELTLLLQDLKQSTVDDLQNFDDLQQRFEQVKAYLLAVLTIKMIAAQRERLNEAQSNAGEKIGRLDLKTQSDFGHLKIQGEEPTALRKTVEDALRQVSELVAQRDKAAVRFEADVVRSSVLSELWTSFKQTVSGSEYAEWTFKSALGIPVLVDFASHWLRTLDAVDKKIAIEQLTATIQGMGGEEVAVATVEELQNQVVEQGFKILNLNWRQAVFDLEPSRLQNVEYYASSMRDALEESDDYNRQAYQRMLSLRDGHADDIIAAFPVWAITNLSISSSFPLKPELFDLVIIDEASQCDIPSALPLIYRAKQVAIIGDAMQLQHIATLTEENHNQLARDFNIATEAFSYSKHSLFDLAARSVGQRPGILLLKEHYRSHQNIIQFSNDEFYEGNLIIKTNLAKREIPASVLENASGIFWLNVRGETIHPAGGSARNTYEANAIKQVLPAIVQQLEKLDWKASLGVVTPYRKQRDDLVQWVEPKFGETITVGTAHTFQGDEREIMIFSTVLAQGISNGSLGWLTATENLLNVAVTRARTILLIVGDLDYCLGLPGNNPYRKLAEYVRQDPERVLRSEAQLPLFSAVATSIDEEAVKD